MGFFKWNRKEAKNKDYKSKYQHDYGLDHFNKDELAYVSLDDELERIIISQAYNAKPEVYLKYSQITNVDFLSEKEMIEKNKSVCGRAVVGGIVLGPLGALVGGMSGIGSKNKTSMDYYMIINYKSSADDEIKVIRLKELSSFSNLIVELRKRITKQDVAQYL